MKITVRFLFFALWVTACTKSPQTVVDNLRCEYKVNPIGMDVLNPRFFWQMTDQRRGTAQTAYQILVSSSEKKLEQNEADIWDSGKVESARSAHVVYGGSPLQSGTGYFWKVRIWNNHGEKSAFSKTATWEMGILSEAGWEANWIGKITEIDSNKGKKWPWKEWIWHPTEINIEKPVYFRKKFILTENKKVASALIRMTVDNKFIVNLNNIELGSGTSREKIYEFDISDKIKKENIIAIEAANTAGTACGVLFSLKVNFADGSEMFIVPETTSIGWKTTNVAYAGWKKFSFNDAKWEEVKFLGDYETSDWGQVDEKEDYIGPRPVLMRNEINIGKKIKRARVFVTGLGGYVMHINGNRVGDAVFTPGWTHYPKRIQYQTFDVGSLLEKGENAIGAVIGNQWWSGGLGWRNNHVYSKGPLRFFMQLKVDYEDGSSQTFVTNEDWKIHDSPILRTNLYDGEVYDARLEEEGWDLVGFDDSVWQPVDILEKAEGRLVAQQGPLIRINKEIKPVAITLPSKGVYVVDMGQNFAGYARLRVKGETGTTVKMRFAETLKPDGNIYRDNLRGADATDSYTLKGKGVEEWQPLFTYHGFRYVELTGFPGEPTLEDLTGLVVYSSAPDIGEFSCSNELLNKVQHNIVWGQKSNMYSVPTDCPQRDERLGWMGDPQIFAPTASYNMEMITFFNKWMRDITDSQDKDGAVHDVSPVIVVTLPASPGYGDAIYIIPWMMYKFYGDKRILEENYDAIVAWVNYMKSNSVDDLYEKNGYGDWVAVEKSPSEPIGSAYYYYGTKLVSTIAGILGKAEDEKEYGELAANIAKAYNEKYFDSANNSYTGNTQTANLIPLSFGIVPGEYSQKVAANIAQNVIKHGNHLTTGFLGVAHLLPVLSNYGFNNLAYTVATQKTYPSWGYFVEKGATTIWELWNGDIEGPEMNSGNHFALGSCGEWYYGYLAGIKPATEAPGFKKIIFSPMPAEGLEWAKASIKTTYGIVSSHWQKKGNTIEYNFNVPVNTTAEFYLPSLEKKVKSVKESEVFVFQNDKLIPSEGIELTKTNKDEAVFSLVSGEYHFVVEYD
ncbi:MAG: family 78 glycoside hydrolase catalytic domain [Draconibacterium sp.]